MPMSLSGQIRVPSFLRPYTRLLRKMLTRILFAGRTRYCPLCERGARKFLSGGIPPRNDARCPYCNALERHRFLWLFLSRSKDLLSPGSLRFLHVAPEACLADQLRKKVGSGYLSADLYNPSAMVRMDLCNISYPDASFDAIYCSHVLEHVDDDRRAMRELRRVLRQDGWAILLVPITVDRTFEDPSITSPEQRLRVFGQEDHVRRYGPDYVDRLREAGFEVRQYRPEEMFGSSEILRYGLQNAGDVFLCRPARWLSSTT